MAGTNANNQFLASVHEDYSAFIDIVSDEELGQFIRAQVNLSKGRTASEISGMAKALFDTHNALMGRLEKSRQKRSAAGKLGVGAKQSKGDDNSANSADADAASSDTNAVIVSRCLPQASCGVEGENAQENEKGNRRKNSRKKEQEADIALVYNENTAGMSVSLKQVVDEWLSYKQEKGKAYAYTKTSLKSLFNVISDKMSKCGEQSVISTIRKSIANNWAGIFFNEIAEDKPNS